MPKARSEERADIVADKLKKPPNSGGFYISIKAPQKAPIHRHFHTKEGQNVEIQAKIDLRR